MRSRRAAALATAVFALVAAVASVPARAAWVNDWYTLYRISRTTSEPERLWITIDLVVGQAEYAYAIFGMQGTGAARRPNGEAYFGDRGRYQATMRDVAGQNAVLCAEEHVCADAAHVGGLDPHYVLDSGIPTTDDYYVLAYGVEPNVTFHDPHWVFRQVGTRANGTRANVRRVTGPATSSGVGAPVAWVEQFHGTPTLPGARGGSIAFALLPCEVAGTGSGELVAAGAPLLDGKRRRLNCRDATHVGTTFAVAAVGRAATWRLAGDVTGASTHATRLLVVDLPRP